MSDKNPNSDCCMYPVTRFPVLVWDCEYGERESQYYIYICPACHKPCEVIQKEKK